jgi:hypothetical protein
MPTQSPPFYFILLRFGRNVNKFLRLKRNLLFAKAIRASHEAPATERITGTVNSLMKQVPIIKEANATHVPTFKAVTLILLSFLF